MLEVLEYVGTLSIVFGVISYFAESGDRVKQKHYQAWQVINTAAGKGGSGGRIDALEELNQDNVPLVGVDVSDSFLQNIDLAQANLVRSNLFIRIRGGGSTLRDWNSLILHRQMSGTAAFGKQPCKVSPSRTPI